MSLFRNPYCQQVIKAGGAPVIIPPTEDPETIINILDSIDGIIFSGGSDFNPLWSGDEPSPHLGHINSKEIILNYSLLSFLVTDKCLLLESVEECNALPLPLGVRLHKISKKAENLPLRACFLMEKWCV